MPTITRPVGTYGIPNPLPQAGNVGDYYFQANGTIWQKKAGSLGQLGTWVVVESAALGIPGPAGQNGLPGSPGTPGAPGAAGATGATGAAGQSTIPTLTPPVDANFTWINQITGAVSTQNASNPLGVNLYCPPTNGGSELVGRLWNVSYPSTPFHIQSYFLLSFLQNNYAFGVFFTDGTKFVALTAQQVDAPPVINFQVYKFNTHSSFNSAYSAGGVSFLAPYWMRLGDTGTNLTFDSSPDGVNWFNVLTVSRTDFMGGGPTGVGWFIYPNWNVSGGSFGNATPQSTTLVHWLQTV
jgi:hypothetical protein